MKQFQQSSKWQGTKQTSKKSVAFLYTKSNHTEEEIMDPPIYSSIKDSKMSWNKPNQGGEILLKWKLQIPKEVDWERN